jgi:hypothetical protein
MRCSTLRFARCSIAILALLLTASAVRAEDYKVKLSRPDKVGDEYTNTVTAKVSQSMTLTVNGNEAPAKTDKFKAECKGTVKVLAINEKTGSATKIRYQVDKLTKNGDELYPQGTVIIAEKIGHQTTYDIDGDRPDAEHAAVLDVVLDVNSTTDEYSDDQTMGTDKAQKVGDTWPIDADKSAKMLSDDELTIDAAHLKGESKLDEVKPVDGTDAMVVTTTMTADNLKNDLPNGATMTDGKMSIELTETMPVDASLQPLIMTAKTSFEMTVQLPQGAGTSVVKVKRELKEVREPAAKH